MDTKEEKQEINCIGVDEKLHVCLPWKKETRCGLKVKTKIVKGQDYTKRFSCYECTYYNSK
jgi:hypothetical protein